jgi:cytochrome P450
MTATPLPAAASLDDQVAAMLASHPAMVEDPYPLYRRLREESPVHFFHELAIVTRYEDVKRIFADSATFKSRAIGPGTKRTAAARALVAPEYLDVFDDLVPTEELFLTNSDDDDHERRRDVARHFFLPKRIPDLEAATKRIADDILDSQLEHETADMEWCAYRLPALLIADLLGVPASDADQLVTWGDTIVRNVLSGRGDPQVLVDAHRAHAEFGAYVLERLQEHRSGRRPTELFGAMIEALDGGLITEKQLIMLFLSVQLGGYATMRVVLSNGLHALLTQRRPWERLVERPDLAAGAAEELIRYTTPAGWVARVPNKDVEASGVRVPAGTTLLTVLASANRDDEVFEDPDTIDIERTNARQHLGFGYGVHFCIGHALGRMEGRVWFETLARRFPDIELASDVTWVDSTRDRRVANFHVSLGRDRGRQH